MKKLFLSFGIIATCNIAVAQSPRLALYEEFTGENCGPCAATNPGLDALLKNAVNANKIVAIKWQVPIPSAPSTTWSLYQTNITEINWRYSAGGYGYQSQDTPASSISSGVNSAPSGRIDGQHAWLFGTAGDHPGYMTSAAIASAQAIMSPFSITMTPAWSPTFTAVTLTVNIQATQNFTSAGSLVFRLVLIEREIHFASAPGSNGEKDFYHPVRKSYPNIQTGTSMTSGWINGQTQTFTINCVLPSYINQIGECSFVGFIQDDGNKKVLQSFIVSIPPMANDADAIAINMPTTICSSTISPQITIKNSGNNAITTMTINPYRDATSLGNYIWSGNLAAGASTSIAMPTFTSIGGAHTYSYNITNVSGGDMYNGNNTTKTSFVVEPGYLPGPVTEGFVSGTFPPLNWSKYNPDLGQYSWSRVITCGGYATSSDAAKYDFYNNPVTGDMDDLYLPPTDLTGITQPVLTFDYAYAPCPCGPSNALSNDKLEVLYSTDCGNSWTTVFSKTAGQLGTVPATTVSFIASAASNWTTSTISIPTLSNNPNALIIFRATNDYGNNLFIDNINLAQAGSVNVAKQSVNAISVNLYPNPTSGDANLSVNSSKNSNAVLKVYNTLGQLMMNRSVALAEGSTTVVVDTKKFDSGVYNVILETENGSLVKKLTVTK
jgi:hypothetical protein